MRDPQQFRDQVVGCLLGGAVGDAIGLPWEGLSRARIAARVGEGPLAHALVGGRGMCSDDTEHACMTGQALLAAPDDPRAFARSLAWRLRGWLLGLPAGIGWGTLRAIVRLWLGWPSDRSGVRSAGNGPAMRAAILGACLGRDPAALDAYLARSTRMTHRDPRALAGARAVARAAAAIVHARGADDPAGLLAELRADADDDELASALAEAERHLARGDSVESYACSLGQVHGITGYIHHTVPAALYCWAKAPRDVAAAVEAAVRLGGDTDTVAAIAGGLAGAAGAPGSIPRAWLEGLWESPRSVAWITALGERLARRFGGASPACDEGPLSISWTRLLLRNACFTAIVLGHGVRRIFGR
ncbi:MAG: ADP-ribosylglycohydrolase family protein [Nannocystaceae bacterium]